jgi:putative protein kinase ArgK-like GTPase of G3E family
MTTLTVPAPDNGHGTDLLAQNLLIGGVPGGGKSYLLDVQATSAAQTGEHDAVLAARPVED